MNGARLYASLREYSVPLVCGEDGGTVDAWNGMLRKVNGPR